MLTEKTESNPLIGKQFQVTLLVEIELQGQTTIQGAVDQSGDFVRRWEEDRGGKTASSSMQGAREVLIEEEAIKEVREHLYGKGETFKGSLFELVEYLESENLIEVVSGDKGVEVFIMKDYEHLVYVDTGKLEKVLDKLNYFEQ